MMNTKLLWKQLIICTYRHCEALVVHTFKTLYVSSNDWNANFNITQNVCVSHGIYYIGCICTSHSTEMTRIRSTCSNYGFSTSITCSGLTASTFILHDTSGLSSISPWPCSKDWKYTHHIHVQAESLMNWEIKIYQAVINLSNLWVIHAISASRNFNPFCQCPVHVNCLLPGHLSIVLTEFCYLKIKGKN